MILLTLGILGMIMVMVVIVSLLAMAKRDDEEFCRMTKILEDGCYKDQQTIREKGQIKQPSEELRKTNLAVAPRASAST